MRKKFKGISLLIVILLVTTFISVKTSEASDVPTKPNFTIQNLKATPNPAKVGEDILVTGQIVPQDFETTVQPKEIVLVLDTSGSMKEKIALDEECTEKRVRYCTTHNSSNPDHYGRWNHNWRDDYCEIHEEIGKHNKTSTKITELKNAAKSFIETMQNVPNLKIGIIEYSTNATIASELKSTNDQALITSIDKLNADGGTNIREGLRKAVYLLSKSNNKTNKTIVLMTDGNPTYYSTYEKLDNTNPKVYGKGSSTDNATMTYTKSLAEKQIRDNNYNSYSIGYGLNTSGTEYLKSIHSSMKGLPSNTEANETNGFFAKSDGSITEIFGQIAENIKASYDLNEVSLEVEFNQGFKLNIEGNEINIGNIIYKKVSESDGRVVYRAEPVNFNFIVKASQVGDNQSIFRNLYIKYPWNEIKERINVQADLKIGIIPNDLPNISAKLLSEKIIETKKGNDINIKYEIKPEEFIYNNASNSGDVDVVVIIEVGKKQGNLDSLKNGIKNKLTDEFQNDKKAKFSFITFNKSETKKEASLKSFENSTNYYHDIRTTIDNIKEGAIAESDEKDISEALNNAYNELEKNSRATATKNIVIIANNDIKYNDEVVKNIKKKGYNIVSLSLESENIIKNLYKLHSNLGGNSDSIFNINNDYNDINNSKMTLVKNQIVSYAAAKPYEFNTVMKLNLGNNFTAIKGIDDSGVVKIPPIVYNLTKNNKYSAKSEFIEITLKVNNLASGIYGFGVGSDNTMTYSSLVGKSIVVNLETPIVKIKDEVKDLVHGLYEGVENNQINIYIPLEGDKTTISPGATVNFGAKFKTSNDDFELTLNGDVKFNQIEVSDIKIYKLNKAINSLEKVNTTSVTDLGDNKFIIKASNLNNNFKDTELIVIYKGTIKENSENESFINSVEISDLNSEVKINTGSYSNSNTEENEEDYQEVLPDLF